jgi:hypothetical protein
MSMGQQALRFHAAFRPALPGLLSERIQPALLFKGIFLRVDSLLRGALYSPQVR